MRIKFLWTLLFVLISFIASNNIQADGNKLLKMCLEAQQFLVDKKLGNKNPVHIGICIGLVQGVNNTMQYYENFMDEPKLSCFPKGGINNEQAIRIAVKYLKEHPEHLHDNETELLFIAFMEAYPCF